MLRRLTSDDLSPKQNYVKNGAELMEGRQDEKNNQTEESDAQILLFMK